MMLQRKGLLSVVGAIFVLAIVSLAFPDMALAQSQQAVRVKIQKTAGPDDAKFGDVLLVKDGENVVLYGLAQSVPSQSLVSITVGAATINRTASYPGKFPNPGEDAIRFSGKETSATLAITYPTSAGVKNATGTLSLDFKGNDVRRDIPHRLLKVNNQETPVDNPPVGYVLLSQMTIGTGDQTYVVDQFEGISGSGNASYVLQSFPSFAMVEVYSEKVDKDNPDKSKRIAVLSTDAYANGKLVSNGSFAPFQMMEANSKNKATVPNVLWLRMLIRGTDGKTTVVLADIKNDVSAEITNNPITVINNNDIPVNPARPADKGIAIISGKADDAYALITVYSKNSDPAAVLAQTTANETGVFSVTIPAIWANNDYLPLTKVYLGVLDNLGNISESLVEKVIDDKCVSFADPGAKDLGNGKFLISGKTEPSAYIVINTLLTSGKVSDSIGGGKADANGDYSFEVSASAKYQVRIIDQAANIWDSAIFNAKLTVTDPKIEFTLGYPNIELNVKAEPYSFIQIYAHYLDKVPATAQTVDTQPANSYCLTYGSADNQGNYKVFVPAGIVSRILYVQAVDIYGNTGRYIGFDLGDLSLVASNLVEFKSVNIQNNGYDIDDIVTGQVVSVNTETPVSGVYVNVYAHMVKDSEFTFYRALSNDVFVNAADGKFSISIPDRDPDTNAFLKEVYMVAFDANNNQPVCFLVLNTDNGLVREGPSISSLLYEKDIELKESGMWYQDQIRVKRIYPAGTPNAGPFQALPDKTLPYIFILGESNVSDATYDVSDDTKLDIYNSNMEIIAIQPLFAQTGIPFPGSPFVDIGDNYWNAMSQTVFGRNHVFVALMDIYGNISTDAVLVKLDVHTFNPDASKIAVTGKSIIGYGEAVEGFSKVFFYKDAAKTQFLGETTADKGGAFSISNLSIKEKTVYVMSVDPAGNESLLVTLSVSNPIESQYLVLDGFGSIHTPSGTVAKDVKANGVAVCLAPADDDPSVIYALYADGTIVRLSPNGADPKALETIKCPEGFAKDLKVINSNPFKAYLLLGNGVIITFGNAPWYGDMVTVDKGYKTLPNRIIMLNTQMRFEDSLIANGQYDTEDKNGNGIPDIVVGLDGTILYNEDIGLGPDKAGAGNGEIDAEPIIDPSSTAQGFWVDIARDLELVKDSNGKVKGYVILDGTGVMWPFGNDIGSDIVKPKVTNGYAQSDIFRDLYLVVENGKILDFITMNGYGQLFANPGGLLGAGKDEKNQFTGYLSADAWNLTTYSFDIARSIELSPIDTNADGKIDYKDGFYILNGFGGIQAVKGAVSIENPPFLGFDIARDLKFGLSLTK